MSITLQFDRIGKQLDRRSYYIQYYPPITMDGRVLKKEYLRLYAPGNPKTPAEKNEARTVRIEADLILAQRRTGSAQMKRDVPKESLLPITEYAAILGGGKLSKKTQDSWRSFRNHMASCGISEIRMRDITLTDANMFRSYLLKSALASATQAKFLGLLKTTLREAMLAELIISPIGDRIKPIKATQQDRQFLTSEELAQLLATPNRSRRTRIAWIHSCLCGMRYSDTKALTWGEVHDLPGGRCELRYTMCKTKLYHVLPISEQNRCLMGKRRSAGDCVFNPPDTTNINRGLRTWAARAGIEKYLSFHCARHTFATLSLAAGTPITVVSAYLGHRSIAQTEVYAKLLDQTKQQYVGAVTVPSIEPPPNLRLVRRKVS